MNDIELPLKDVNLTTLLKETELEYILWALKLSDNVIEHAATLLGLKRTALRMRMNRFKILMSNRNTRKKIVKLSDDSQLSFW